MHAAWRQLILAIAGLIQAIGPATPLRGSGSSVPILIEMFLGSAYSLLYIATAVLFIVWLYRAHKNLQFLHPDLLEFSDAAAIGWWFAPIFSLFRPFQVVREVWAESEPGFDPDSASLISKPAQRTGLHGRVVDRMDLNDLRGQC